MLRPRDLIWICKLANVIPCICISKDQNLLTKILVGFVLELSPNLDFPTVDYWLYYVGYDFHFNN